METVSIMENVSKYYNPHYEKEINDFMRSSKEDIKYTKILVLSACKELKKIQAQRIEDQNDSEDGDYEYEYEFNPKEDIIDIIANILDKLGLRHVESESKEMLDDFFRRKPNVEWSDELTYYKTQFGLSKVCNCIDPTSQYFSLFIGALRQFVPYAYAYGIAEDIRDTLSKALPLISFFYAVISGKIDVNKVLLSI